MTAEQLGARLDRLPMSRFHRRLVIYLAIAFFFELADLNTISYAAPALIKYWNLSISTIASITSAGFLGMFLGAVFGGTLSDVLGRLRSLRWSVAFYSIFSLANAFAFNVPTLLITRFLTGVGLSAMTVVAITYLAELVPKDRRGRLQAATLATGLLGIPAVALVARAVVPTGPDGWRWIFVFGALGILLLFTTRHLPASPRWLIANGRETEAESTLKRIEDEVSADVGELPPVEEIEQATEETPGLRSLFSGTLARWTAMLWLVWIFSTLGFYGFMAWVPTLLADRGFDLVHSLTFSLIISLGAVPGAFFAWPLSDRFGRRGPILIISLVIAAVGVAYGLSFNAVAIAVFGFLVAFFIQTGAALLYAYTPEVYPTGQRNKGTGFAYSLGRLANVFSPLIVAGIFGSFGYLPIFVYIAGCYVITALVVGLLGPRTGAVSLERINPLKKFESANSQIADIHNRGMEQSRKHNRQS